MSSYEANPYASPAVFNPVAALAGESERVGFIRRTYAHLAGAVALFVLIETAIFTLVPPDTLARTVGSVLGRPYGWLMVLGGFMAVGWIADYWARSDTSRGLQYLGLGLFVLAEAIIFVPLLLMASSLDERYLIPSAGLLTLIIFGGLTATVFVTRTDLASWGKYLMWGGLMAMGLIVGAIIFEFSLGFWFSLAMIGFASAYILYYTSNILHHYRVDQHVAASLALFSAVALLFWYILQLLMSLSRD